MNKFLIEAGRFSAALVVLAMSLSGVARASDAASWPSRPVRLVVPYTAGSYTDRLGRTIGQQLGAALGQPFVVENRPGAGATIGADFVARSDPDGYTLLLGNNAPMAVNASFMKLPYDPIKSFAPVSLVGTIPNILLVGPSVKAKTVAEMLDYARANPGKMTYSSSGIGNVGHLGMEMLGSMTNTEYLHIPANGSTQALQEVMAGRVDMVIDSIALSAPLVQEGRLRGLATTDTKRAPARPDLPTLSEAGVPGYQLLLWFGLFAPAGTPQPIIDKVHDALARAFANPETTAPYTRDGMNVVTSTPQELATFQRGEITKWKDLIGKLHLQLGQ